MKVQNTTIFMGDDAVRARHEDNAKKDSRSGSINASSLNQKFDPIAAKRAEARKKAMKVIGDVFTNEKKIDDDIASRHEKIKELQSQKGEAAKFISKTEEDRTALRDTYGVLEDSEEEKELKLLEKEVDAKIPGSGVLLTLDEKKKIEEIKAGGLTEYQERSLEMKKSEVPYAESINEANIGIETENAVIRAIKIERLKTHAMVDAQKEAENIMDAASEEIVGMLADEAKDHIDEEMEKKEESAEEKAEEKKELEERIEKTKEEKKEQEELTEDIIEGAQEITSASANLSDAKQEIKDMMNKMKLVEEDIKGAAVDESL